MENDNATKIVISYNCLQEEARVIQNEEHGWHLHTWFEEICHRVERLVQRSKVTPGEFRGYPELIEMFNHYKEKHM